ncbi:MAG TPA: lipocalin-like domain-containing protein [Chloroflexota bacterium]|nr:lipocalin-like domain-containing protein [Chloroflexota bacterium]
MFRPCLAALVLLLAGCGTKAVSLPSAPLVAGQNPLVHLPRDQGNHPHDANEWWYVVGHLRAGTHSFGYEVTIFRLSHLNLPSESGPGITLYRTDLAITDETAHRFYHTIQYHFPGSGTFTTGRLGVHVGPAGLSGSLGAMTVTAALPSGALHLTLASRRPAMAVGGRGYLSFGNGFTYYYSLTDLATGGILRLKGHVYHVTGISWLDHQWGNWSWRAIRGWTWMALQLSDGTQLSVFDFRGQVHVLAASVLQGTHVRTVHDVRFTSLGSWRSPTDGAVYPIDQRVQIPSLRADLRVIPTVADQEMALPSQPVGSYWEGSGRVSGTFRGRAVTGYSYTELTGYTHGTPAP